MSRNANEFPNCTFAPEVPTLWALQIGCYNFWGDICGKYFGHFCRKYAWTILKEIFLVTFAGKNPSQFCRKYMLKIYLATFAEIIPGQFCRKYMFKIYLATFADVSLAAASLAATSLASRPSSHRSR